MSERSVIMTRYPIMLIRPEHPTELNAIWQINASAFETDAEADLVDSLRKSDIRYISLVHEKDDELLGHIF